MRGASATPSRDARAPGRALVKCPENLGTTDRARSRLAQGAGAYYAPSVVTIYRAESAARAPSEEHARAVAEDQTAFERLGPCGRGEEARERAERYRAANAARASAKQAMDAAEEAVRGGGSRE